MSAFFITIALSSYNDSILARTLNTHYQIKDPDIISGDLIFYCECGILFASLIAGFSHDAVGRKFTVALGLFV